MIYEGRIGCQSIYEVLTLLTHASLALTFTVKAILIYISLMSLNFKLEIQYIENVNGYD